MHSRQCPYPNNLFYQTPPSLASAVNSSDHGFSRCIGCPSESGAEALRADSASHRSAISSDFTVLNSFSLIWIYTRVRTRAKRPRTVGGIFQGCLYCQDMVCSQILFKVSCWMFIPIAVEKSFEAWTASRENVLPSCSRCPRGRYTDAWRGSIEITAWLMRDSEFLEASELFENYVARAGA